MTGRVCVRACVRGLTFLRCGVRYYAHRTQRVVGGERGGVTGRVGAAHWQQRGRRANRPRRATTGVGDQASQAEQRHPPLLITTLSCSCARVFYVHPAVRNLSWLSETPFQKAQKTFLKPFQISYAAAAGVGATLRSMGTRMLRTGCHWWRPAAASRTWRRWCCHCCSRLERGRAAARSATCVWRVLEGFMWRWWCCCHCCSRLKQGRAACSQALQPIVC